VRVIALLMWRFRWFGSSDPAADDGFAPKEVPRMQWEESASRFSPVP
jgi:hypothetical protein